MRQRSLREEELKKKWEEEAPLRKAEAERQKELCKKWKEQKNKKPVYLKCEECDKPKKTDSQQKWPLCYDCYNKSSDED
jgi:hypothetical protein